MKLINKEDYNRYEFFWKGPFSQWHRSPFEATCIQTFNSIKLHVPLKFNYAETFMMVNKDLYFTGGKNLYKMIEADKAGNPKLVKTLGREVKPFDKEIWDSLSTEIVYDGNYHKFKQNPLLLEELLETSGKLIVEASPFDVIWGIGMDEREASKIDPKDWPGENRLGLILTTLRENLLLVRDIVS